jgi:hypothetical protein
LTETEEKDEAYRQRNFLVAALARLFPSGIRRTTDIDGGEWQGCCYIDLPSGQISYHYHDSQAFLFENLPPYEKPWDGHDKEMVHSRLVGLGYWDFSQCLDIFPIKSRDFVSSDEL